MSVNWLQGTYSCDSYVYDHAVAYQLRMQDIIETVFISREKQGTVVIGLVAHQLGSSAWNLIRTIDDEQIKSRPKHSEATSTNI